MKPGSQKSRFIKIAESYGIAPATAEELFDVWRQESRFNFINVVYYFGGLLIILAMTWFIIANWKFLDGYGIASVGSMYMLLFGLLGYRLWKKHTLWVPGGILITAAVCTTPLIVYGLECVLGLWPDGIFGPDPGAYTRHVRVFLMEVTTLLVGTAALYFVRFPFITAPIAFTLWCLFMHALSFYASDYSTASILFGFTTLLSAFLIDRRTKEDYAFWIYLVGLIIFWSGLLSYIFSKAEFWQLLWGGTNLGLIIISVLLQRKTFIVFGIAGFLGYLGHLAYEVFKESTMFPLVLSAIGLAFIGLGVVYQKNTGAIERFLMALLPDSMKKHLPIYRENSEP